MQRSRRVRQGMQGLDITPLFDTIIKHCPAVPGPQRDEPLQLQVSALGYDDYIGRLGIGRITRGVIKGGKHCGGSQGRRSDRTEEDQSGIRIQRTEADGCGPGGSRRHCRRSPVLRTSPSERPSATRQTRSRWR